MESGAEAIGSNILNEEVFARQSRLGSAGLPASFVGKPFGRATPAQRPKAGRKFPQPALLLAASLVAILTLLITKREAVVMVAPHLAGLYAGMGLPANNRGVKFQDVKSLVSDEGSQRILMVQGQIANIRTTPTNIPELRLSVRAENGREVYHWFAPAPKAQLAVGEAIPFRARLLSAPEDGKEVRVQFAERNPAPVMPQARQGSAR